MALVMKSDGEQEMWKRQLSGASTELPSSPPMSRMVSQESHHDDAELTGEIGDDSVDGECGGFPNETHSAVPSRGAVAFVPVLIGFFIYGLMNSFTFLIFAGILISVFNGCTLHYAWLEDLDKEVKAMPEDCKEEDDDSQNQDATMHVHIMIFIYNQIIDSFYWVCVYGSILACIAAVAILLPWALLLLPPVYFCLSDDRRTEEDCEEEDDGSQNQDAIAARSSVSQIIDSFYWVCVYGSIFACIAAVAILLPWALLLLPPVYLCLTDYKEEDDDSQNQDATAASSSVSRIIDSFYGVCVYGSIFACIAAVAILLPWALLLLPPVYLCLTDDRRTEEDCEEEDDGSQNQDATAARSAVSQIIDSFYWVCVYGSIFACIAAVAILLPWALLLLPPVYLCLTDDRRTEDCEEEDDGSQKQIVAPESSPSIWDLMPSFGACIYTIVFVLVGVLAIVAILLPAALVFCLKD